MIVHPTEWFVRNSHQPSQVFRSDVDFGGANLQIPLQRLRLRNPHRQRGKNQAGANYKRNSLPSQRPHWFVHFFTFHKRNRVDRLLPELLAHGLWFWRFLELAVLGRLLRQQMDSRTHHR